MSTGGTTITWPASPPAPPVAPSWGAPTPAPTGAPNGVTISTQYPGPTGPDVDPCFRLISDPDQVLAEALLRRLGTPRGGLFYDLNYGFDLRNVLNASLSSVQVAQLQIAIAQECSKDPRVQSASATFALNNATGSATATIAIVSAAGPFTLVCSVTAISVTLLSLQ